MDLKEFTYDNLLPQVGTVFRIAFPDRTVELTLSRVDLLREKHTSKRLYRDSFSLIFQGPTDVMLPQGMYPLDHQALGEQKIFIVPIATAEGGFEYEAVFT